MLVLHFAQVRCICWKRRNTFFIAVFFSSLTHFPAYLFFKHFWLSNKFSQSIKNDVRWKIKKLNAKQNRDALLLIPSFPSAVFTRVTHRFLAIHFRLISQMLRIALERRKKQQVLGQTLAADETVLRRIKIMRDENSVEESARHYLHIYNFICTCTYTRICMHKCSVISAIFFTSTYFSAFEKMLSLMMIIFRPISV